MSRIGQGQSETRKNRSDQNKVLHAGGRVYHGAAAVTTRRVAKTAFGYFPSLFGYLRLRKMKSRCFRGELMVRTFILSCLTCCLIQTPLFASSGAPARVPQGEADRAGMSGDTWSTAIKQAFGTSYESYDSDTGFSSRSATAPVSRVWFTAAQGILTEVFWPTIDTPQVKDSQFIITTADGKIIEECKGTQSSVEWIQTGVPAYRITNRDPQGRFVIEKTFFADPDRDTVVQRVRIQKNVAGLNFYILHNPSVANSPLGDSARVSLGAAPGAAL